MAKKAKKAAPAPVESAAAETPRKLSLPDPFVYCGPTIKGVARQYTIYQGGVPREIEEYINAHPLARQLMVSTSAFADTRRKLEIPGTAEAMIYKRLKEE